MKAEKDIRIQVALAMGWTVINFGGSYKGWALSNEDAYGGVWKDESEGASMLPAYTTSYDSAQEFVRFVKEKVGEDRFYAALFRVTVSAQAVRSWADAVEIMAHSHCGEFDLLAMLNATPDQICRACLLALQEDK